MIFCTPSPLRASMFWRASIWNTYSLPERRAGSPVHSSFWPRMAKSTPARWSSLAVAMRHLLVAVVEAGGAADPVEVLVVEAPAGRVDDGDLVGQAPGPLRPIALAQAPGVRGVLHAPVGVAELGREVRLHEGVVAPDVEDLVEDLDVDRADLVAGLAGGAGPDLLGRDPLQHRIGRDRDVRVDGDRRRHRRLGGGGHDLADLEDDLPGVERLAGLVGRAHRRAAPADRCRRRCP